MKVAPGAVTETIPAKQWTKKLSHEDRKSTKLGSLQVLNADSTRNRTAHPNMDTKTQRRSSSPYSRATGLQLGQRRRRVLGTHGRPVTGVHWWASKGGRILHAYCMVGRVAPWHDIA